MRASRWGFVGLLALGAAGFWVAGCNDGTQAPASGAAGNDASGAGGQAGAAGGAAGPIAVTPVTISTTTRTARTTTWSVNYWQWAPTYGDDVAGTETLVAALTPAYLRVGGYNNDANTPDPFDGAQIDTMVAYARAIGAEPILQVPHLADTSGAPPTADTAAAMVQYANVTMGYGIKYFSVGNEPDLYDAQGLPSDSSQPAIPGYSPADYCASATDYVAAMKLVDPTIKIVGPDLAYKYQAGNGSYDWLTPILQTCGDLFDVVSIHRYPFEAMMANLTSAAADVTSFQQVMTSVREILQATGYGGKPLALTEMNVAYDATSCVIGASPGTVGSALWLADILGSAIGLDLWTSAVWDISDTEDWALGLIGVAPTHVPRPEYYAYALYADHFGPTLLAAPVTPTGVDAYASRNITDDATEVILVNWTSAAVALKFNVTGLATAPAAPTFLFPGVSMAAVEIRDDGTATAWTYGEAERAAAVGPQVIAEGTAPAAAIDGGAGGGNGAGKVVGTGCATDGGVGLICPQFVASSPLITTAGTSTGAGPSFGAAPDAWGSYSYAAPGQIAPTGTVTSDGNGLHIVGGFVTPVTAADDYAGFGLYYSGNDCLNATAYTGVKFDYTGDLGGCHLALGMSFSGDQSHQDDTMRGACAASDSNCYGPSVDVTSATTTQALAVVQTPTTVEVPFKSLSGGMPLSLLDPSTIVTVQWQLTSPVLAGDGGSACSADFTVENVQFY